MFKVLILLFCIYVQSEIINVNTYNEIFNYIKAYINVNTVNIQDILFVSDIDNVLFTYENDVGTDQWNNWQIDLINNKNNNAITNSFTDFITILTHIMNYKQHKLCEDNIPNIINNLHSIGINTLALTSRNPNMYNSTINELYKYNIFFNNSYVFDINIMNTKYINNVFFTAGINKGIILASLLANNVMYIPKKIFFVDDHIKHIHNVIDIFNNTNINITGFLYNHELDRVIKFNDSSKIEAYNEWNYIKKLI